MHPLKRFLGLSLATAATLSLTRRTETALDEHLRVEVRRLQAHFDSVDVELKERDVAHLTHAQRASRDSLVAWLRDYRDAAAFPLNDGVASLSAVPIFRDSRGVLCAMAYLIDRSGRSDIVDAVAATRNNASIFELADDARLIAWLDSTGLSSDEAARIQPSYGPPRNEVDVNYAIASVLLSGTALATLGVNVAGPSRLSGWIGFVAGTVATASGLIMLEEPRATRRLGAVNIGAGSLSMALSLRGIFRSSRPATLVPVSARNSDVHLSPTVGLLGSPQIGFVMRARF